MNKTLKWALGATASIGVIAAGAANLAAKAAGITVSFDTSLTLLLMVGVGSVIVLALSADSSYQRHSKIDGSDQLADEFIYS